MGGFLCALLVKIIFIISVGNVAGLDVNPKHNYIGQYYRRQQCSEYPLEYRQSTADVIFTGTIRALDQSRRTATVELKRIIKSDIKFDSKTVSVLGVGDPTVCHSEAKMLDSFIFLTTRLGNGDQLKLNSSLIRITLKNLDQIEMLAKRGTPQTEDTFGRRNMSLQLVSKHMNANDNPCSVIKCTHGAHCVSDGKTGRCECPADCESNDGPVCGTDNNDYSSECEMTLSSCRQMKDIDKKYDGYCDSCRDKKCQFHAECVSDGKGSFQCICPSKSSCRHHQKASDTPVCASDGQTYDSQCEMHVASCIKRQIISPSDPRHCDRCANVECSKSGQHCVDGQCVCHQTVCPTTYQPVCGSDFVTYPNQCTLEMISCTEDLNIQTLYIGGCVDDGSGLEDILQESPAQVVTAKSSIKKCDDRQCRYGAVCNVDAKEQQCICQFSCDAVRSTVCGSDGKIYPNECKMQEESCRKQADITAQPAENCEDIQMEVEICDGKPALMNPFTGHQYNCDNEACPSGSYCHKVAQQVSRCCLAADGPTGCDGTEFGCCTDGVTPALGPRHAGCPDSCNCNVLGSYGMTCDPVTSQCRCRTGVGGLRCDRCEPSFWGLHLVSDRNTGCTPCGCNLFGSVRDDCDQMTGRCLCQAGITGHKCNLCANGDHIGPNGCTDVMQNDECSCHFGAVCSNVGCICPLKCTSSSRPVCGTDGRTYRSPCHLKRASCRQQKHIRIKHVGNCS